MNSYRSVLIQMHLYIDLHWLVSILIDLHWFLLAYICVHAYIYIYIYIYVFFICLHICKYIYIYIYVHRYTFIHVPIYIYIYIYIHICIYVSACMCVCVCVCVRVCACVCVFPVSDKPPQWWLLSTKLLWIALWMQPTQWNPGLWSIIVCLMLGLYGFVRVCMHLYGQVSCIDSYAPHLDLHWCTLMFMYW